VDQSVNAVANPGEMINPQTLTILGPRILVKLYERPDQIGSILLPDKYKRDHTWTLWEVVKPTSKFNEEVGLELKKDDILQTLKRIPVHVGCDDAGVDYFIMDAVSCGFRGYTRWKEENE